MSVPYSQEWLRSFKEKIIEYNENRAPDPFMNWFRDKDEMGFFSNDFEKVLVVLIDARFDQRTTAENALQNTVNVVRFGALKTCAITRGELPLLIPRHLMTAQEWTKLFCDALPKLHELSKKIVSKKSWTADALFQLMRTECRVPYLGVKTSRLAVRWLHELVDVLETDMRNYNIPVDSLVYRVVSRLGVIDPNTDKYYGNGSPADLKIQGFVQELFPDKPWIMDEPLWATGRRAKNGGHCFPTNPSCWGCIFESLCSKKFTDFAPESLGMDTTRYSRANKIVVRKKAQFPSEKQLAFAGYVEELKQKGIRGADYREKVAQWQREHNEDKS